MFSNDEIEKMKKIQSKPKRVVEKKRERKSDILKDVSEFTDSENKLYKKLAMQLGGMIIKNTNIVSSKKEKENDFKNKNEFKRAGGGFDKIHSEEYLHDVISTSNQFIKELIRSGEVKELRDIKPRMVEEFCRVKMERGDWSFRSLETKIGHFKKIGEAGAQNGLMKFNKLVTRNTEGLKGEYRPEGTMKSNRTRNRKENGSTLSVREARVMAKHMEEKFGPMGRAATNFLLESGVRKDEFDKIRWSDIDFDNRSVNLTRKNMTKNGRERITIGISEKTMSALKEIKSVLDIKNDNQTAFRSYFGSTKVFEESLKSAARSGKVGYLGLHAFRSASKEYQTKQLEKIKKKYITENGQKEGLKLYKDHLAKTVMKHVSISDKLNPVIDEKTGLLKFDEQKMRNQRVDTLERLVLSQNFGHNRTSVINYYG